MDKKPDAPDKKYTVKLNYEIPPVTVKMIGGKFILPVKEERTKNHEYQNENQHSYCIF